MYVYRNIIWIGKKKEGRKSEEKVGLYMREDWELMHDPTEHWAPRLVDDVETHGSRAKEEQKLEELRT